MKKIAIMFFLLAIFNCAVYADTKEYLNLSFWEKFNDENLIENLIKVYENNNDLKAAVLKVDEAQRAVNMSFANELPHLGFEGYVGRIFKSSDELFGDVKIPNYSETHYYLPLTMSYEADIWGKNRLKTKSKKKQLEIIKQDERSAYIYVTSAFAADYFNLIRCDKLINYQNQLISLQEQVINSYRIKYELGTATLTDIEESEKALTYMKEDLHKLLEKQDILKNQISVLISDRSFEDIKRSDWGKLNFDLKTPNQIQFDMLNQRPDRIKSELDLEKIGLDVKAARRDMLPSFIITGNLGFNMYNISSSHKFLTDLGIIPVWDLFTGGQKMQLLKLKKSQYEIAVQKYEKVILSAIQETNDALYSLKTAKNIKSETNERLNSDIRELNYTKIRQEAGIADNLDVLTYQKRWLISQKQALDSEINCVISTINLYQALGGADFTENKYL